MDKHTVDIGKYYYSRPSWRNKRKATVTYNSFYEELEVWIDGEGEGILISDIPNDAIFEEI